MSWAGSMLVAVIDYGLGNIFSVCNAIRLLGHQVQTPKCSSDVAVRYDAFVLPGVGSFPQGIQLLRGRGLDKVIEFLVKEKTPGLGICLGMQLLSEWSLEGGTRTEGLGYFRGGFERLNDKRSVVPHVGWSRTRQTSKRHGWHDTFNSDFYYVHSYAMSIDSPDRVATCLHGDKLFTAAVQNETLLGVQFHPEKSQASGLRLIKSFLEHTGG